MEGISRLGLSASRRAFSEAKLIPFQAPTSFSGGVRIELSFQFNEGLFVKVKGSKILLDQGDQFLIRLIKILQVSNGQHLIVKIGVGL